MDMTQSMVAMLGWIMPEPLTKPPTWTSYAEPSAAGSLPTKDASFATVSVVMTAQAASWAASGVAARASAAAGTPVSNGPKLSSWPMTPVEATSTSAGLQPSVAATRSAVRRAVARPGSPVAALAFPELRMTARAQAVGRCARGRRSTGAAQKRLVVKVPAATQVWSATTRAMSRRLGSRRKPARRPAQQRRPRQRRRHPHRGQSQRPRACPGRSEALWAQSRSCDVLSSKPRSPHARWRCRQGGAGLLAC